MKNIRAYLLLLFIVSLSFCSDENEITSNYDLKTLSLPELKQFLSGKWRLHRSVKGTIAGNQVVEIPDDQRVYLIFYPVDSIRRESTISNIVIREKLVYEWRLIPGITPPQSANVLLFDYDGYGYRHQWVADRLDNDTLIFEDYFKSEGGDRFYYTRE